MSETTKRDDLVAVPALFWNDHADRHPTDDGAPIATPVGRRGRCVLIAADDPGLHWLRSDAEYYADAESMDECPRRVRDSARRTVAVLARFGGAK